jgi:hypothetical protein
MTGEGIMSDEAASCDVFGEWSFGHVQLLACIYPSS